MSLCSERLFHLRYDCCLTQQDVADYLHISRTVYNYYENARRSVPLHILWVLADYYDVSIDYLCGRTNLPR